DRVLAAPALLPLGARQRLRTPHALHHPRHPPRPPQRQDAAGDAAGGLDPARRSLLLPLHPRLRHAAGLPPLRPLHPRVPLLRLHALLRAPLRAQVRPRQAPARAAHAPPLPGPPLRLRRLLAPLGRRLPDAAQEAPPLESPTPVAQGDLQLKAGIGV